MEQLNMAEIDSARIARIDERSKNHTKWAEEHDKLDTARFDRTFKFMTDSFGKIESRFDELEVKIDTLWDIKNKQEGAISISKIFYCGVVAVGGAVAGYLGGRK
jgi:hypothetical protein